MIRVAHTSNIWMKGLESFLDKNAMSVHASDTVHGCLTLVCEELIFIVWVTYWPLEPITVWIGHLYLLVNDNVNLYSLLSFAFQDLIKTPLWMVCRRAT